MPRLNMTESETRALILDEAQRLFEDIGYDKTTVADIARACGFSSANVHRVLGTKAAINRAIAARKLGEKLERAKALADAENSAHDKLFAFAKSIHETTSATLMDQQRVHHMVARAIEERWEEVTEYRLGLRRIAREIIEHGVKTGEFAVDDVDAATDAFHLSAMRFFHPLAVAEMQDAPDGGDITTWFSYAVRMLER